MPLPLPPQGLDGVWSDGYRRECSHGGEFPARLPLVRHVQIPGRRQNHVEGRGRRGGRLRHRGQESDQGTS